jgi:bacterioferritin
MAEIIIERRTTQRREGAKAPPPASQSERRVRERRQGEPARPGYFISDVEEIRRRARTHIERGAVTEGYKADRETVIRILNEALATEIVCVLRYKRHYFMATGIHAQAVAQEFLEHANDEQGHADRIAGRITQIGGAPNFNPEGLASRSHAQYVEGETLVDMIREDLIAERIAIESYGEIVRFLGDNDITSRRLMEEILANEEEHADDLRDLLATLDPTQPGD